MKKIRMCVFETNSSAVHSLIIPIDLIEKSELEINEDGMIEVGFITSDTEYPIFTQYDKLSYLITQLYYSTWNYDGTLGDNYEFGIIRDYVCEYTGAKGIKINYDQEPDINHQAQWVNGENRCVDIYDKDALISFIFGPMMVKEYMD